MVAGVPMGRSARVTVAMRNGRVEGKFSKEDSSSQNGSELRVDVSRPMVPGV